jgi:PAS domain S-box-containing protein
MKISFAELIADASLDTVVITTPDGDIVRWSKGAEAALGYTCNEILGRPDIETLQPGDQQQNARVSDPAPNCRQGGRRILSDREHAGAEIACCPFAGDALPSPADHS